MAHLLAELSAVRLFVYDFSQHLNFDIRALAPGSAACSVQCAGASTGKVYDGQEAADLCNYGYGRLLPLAPEHPLAGLAWSNNDGDTDVYHLFHRLLNSTRRVHDPLAANVFFLAAPFYQIRHKPYPRYEACGLHHNSGDWAAILDWLGQQPAWRRSGGRDHFTFLTKPYVWSRKGAPLAASGPAAWADHPVHAQLMANVVKATHWGVQADERAVAMPFSTFVHAHRGVDLPRALDRLFAAPRRHAMSYIGGMWRGGAKGPYALKQKNWSTKRRVGAWCHREATCHALFTDGPPDARPPPGQRAPPALTDVFPHCGNDSMPSRVVAAWPRLGAAARTCGYPQLTYLESEFCLTPPGDAPSRRGLFDALLMGCIPVLFEPLTALYPWFWSRPALERIAVVASPRDLRDGGGGLAARLAAITLERRGAMRAAIREVWPTLQYSYDESADHADAVDVLLAHVLKPGVGAVLE